MARAVATMAKRYGGPRNRNGLVGEFQAFLPRRRTIEELIARRDGKAPPAAKESRDLLAIGDHMLVRYRIGSDELDAAFGELGGDKAYVHPDLQHITAMFGLVGPDGRPKAVVEVIDDGDRGGPGVHSVLRNGDAAVPGDVMRAVLDALDVPASWNSGADAQIRDHFDLSWDQEDGGWKAVEPVHLVKVTYKRICFATRPVAEESIDVFLPHEPEFRLDDPDPDKAYWARDRYRYGGFEELGFLNGQRGARPGFSSWSPDGDPVLVKVVGDNLDAEIERLARADDVPAEGAEDEAEPAGFRP